MKPCTNDGYDFLSAESLAKQAAKEPSMSTPPTGTPDLAERLEDAVQTAIDTFIDAEPTYLDRQNAARAAVVAMLRELAADTAGYPELITTDELLALADMIDGAPRA